MANSVFLAFPSRPLFPSYGQSCVNRPESVHEILHFLCENFQYVSVYFKDLHKLEIWQLTDNMQSGGSCIVSVNGVS